MKAEKIESPARAVLFWLSREEAADAALAAELRIGFEQIKEKKYLPVILESGGGKLEESIYMLIKRSLENSAKSGAADE